MFAVVTPRNNFLLHGLFTDKIDHIVMRASGSAGPATVQALTILPPRSPPCRLVAAGTWSFARRYVFPRRRLAMTADVRSSAERKRHRLRSPRRVHAVSPLFRLSRRIPRLARRIPCLARWIPRLTRQMKCLARRIPRRWVLPRCRCHALR